LKDIGSRGTPVAAIILSAFLGGGLLLFSNHFNELASISVITTLLPYIFICLSAYRLFIEKKIRLIAGIGAITTIAILILFFTF
jgi:amino acid transporter